jgi:DNA invertase Pin-like site-specific DNA recombinase
MKYSYARVSTEDQTLDAQFAQLRADDCARIYRKKATGAQPTRRELLRMLKVLSPRRRGGGQVLRKPAK